MVEKGDMGIFDEDGELDFFNSLSTAKTFLLMFLMILAGAAAPLDTGLILAGLVFAIPLIMAHLLWKNILTSNASWFEGAAGYVVPHFFLLAITGLTSFSVGRFFSAPASEGGYLFSLLGQQSPTVRAVFNNNLAPFVETYFIFSMTFIFIYFLLEAGGKEKLPGGGWTVAGIASAPGSVLFAYLHFNAPTHFLIMAFILMFVSLVLIFGEEITDRDHFAVPMLLSLGVGIHRPLNIDEYGGYTEYFNSLMAASGTSEILLSITVLLFDLIMLSVFAIGLGKRLGGSGE